MSNQYHNELEDEDVILKFQDFYVIDQNDEIEVPSYGFWIYSKDFEQVVGHLSLRTQTTDEEELYWGNLGYTVFPKFRGNRFAFKASQLALIFARQQKMSVVYMTTDPTNAASKKTILNLGGEYLNTIPVPHDTSLYQAEKCELNERYRLVLTDFDNESA